jgi:Pyridoxamine 5'-phosphate oxidase
VPERVHASTLRRRGSASHSRMPLPTASRPAAGGPAEPLPWTWVEERLTGTWNFWLATFSPEHGPHTRPVWCLWCDAGLLFTCSPTSRKARDFLAEPRVSVHAELEREVVVVDGAVEDARPSDVEVGAYEAKYGWRPPEGQRWFVVRPRCAYASIEASYPAQATRFDFA